MDITYGRARGTDKGKHVSISCYHLSTGVSCVMLFKGNDWTYEISPSKSIDQIAVGEITLGLCVMSLEMPNNVSPRALVKMLMVPII
jgi:hypothetical protein